MRAAAGPGVFSCEEFCAEAPAATSLPPPPAAPPRAEEPISFKGLCANCENRATCTLLRPESGVWHCEEYR